MNLIRSSQWQIAIAPASGGSIAYGLVRVGQGWYDFMRPTPVGDRQAKMMASFIMTPWCNRIRAGAFTFDDTAYQLRINNADGTAIHGIGRDHAWQIVDHTPTALTLTLDSRALPDPNFPFAFTCTQTFTVEDGRFSLHTHIANVDTRPIPVGFGHHPYFQRVLTGDHDPVSLEIPYSRTYTLIDALPTGEVTTVDPRIDFRALRPLGTDFIDDVLTDRAAAAPIRFVYPASGIEIHMQSDAVFRHLVVYAPQGKPYFAVEPVTNLNDGINLLAAGNTETGVIVLPPGGEAAGTITLDIVRS